MSDSQVMESRVANLSSLSPATGSTKDRTRVGRGIGSGKGKTCGRGHKGQKSRSGKKIPPTFEGGQMPIHRRIPKRGFSSRKAASWLRLPTSSLSRFEPGEVSIETLRRLGIISHTQNKVKFYRSGDVSAAYVVKGIAMTAGAKADIESAGGKLEEGLKPTKEVEATDKAPDS